MWNQIAPKSRFIFTSNRLYLNRKRLINTQSTIKFAPHRYLHNSQRFTTSTINNVSRQRSITLLPNHFYSTSISTSNTSIVSTDQQQLNMATDKEETDDHKRKLLIDEVMLDKLFYEMDQRLHEVDQFKQTNGKSRPLKIYGFTLVVMIAGVSAGAYAAHLGAWFLDKVGLFIFEEEDDDD